LIALVHLPSADPNFLHISCRNAEELKKKAEGAPGRYLNDRHDAIERYIEEARETAKNAVISEKVNGETFEEKIVKFLEVKKDANVQLYEVFKGTAGAERENSFFHASQVTWTEGLPDVFSRLESLMKGPYALGDQVVSVLFAIMLGILPALID
jgi:hypothetical protein